MNRIDKFKFLYKNSRCFRSCIFEISQYAIGPGPDHLVESNDMLIGRIEDKYYLEISFKNIDSMMSEFNIP